MGRAHLSFVERTWIQEGVIEVVKVWEGFDLCRGRFKQETPRIFRVAEFRWAAGKIKDLFEREMLPTEVGGRNSARCVGELVALKS